MPELLPPKELFALVVQADKEKREFIVALALSVLEATHAVAAEFTSEAHCTGQGCDYCTNLALVRAQIEALDA